MSYKCRFSELIYETKIRIILRFFLLFLGEQVLNYFFYDWGISLSIFPIILLIFAQKYFTFFRSTLLFLLILIFYDTFSGFSILEITLINAVAYGIAYFFDFEKISAIAFLFTQNFLFYLADTEICAAQIKTSLLVHTIIILFIRLDIVPRQIRKKENIFL